MKFPKRFLHCLDCLECTIIWLLSNKKCSQNFLKISQKSKYFCNSCNEMENCGFFNPPNRIPEALMELPAEAPNSQAAILFNLT